MNSTICTLFEGDYQYGLGALVNSLYAQGFRGIIWVGYRGGLPIWAKPATATPTYSEFKVGEECAIRFLPLETEAHLTNFKPDFMLSVLERHDPACEALFYIDPDVIVCRSWHLFEEWVSCGVAVCEDVNSPMALLHPHRIGWRRWFEQFGFFLRPREPYYANGGFVGVTRENREFLLTWKRLQDAMWTIIGGADVSCLPGGLSIAGRRGFFDCFEKTDQDVLNAAIEAAGDIPVSFLGRQAMAFEAGKHFLLHPIGPLKPWRNRIIRNALKGLGRPLADKHYWQFVDSPIRLYSRASIRRRRVALAIAASIGRFIGGKR